MNSTPIVRSPALGCLVLAALLTTAAPTQAAEATDTSATQDLFQDERLEALKFRNIGPFRGGRVTAVTGVPGQLDTYFMGTTGGGVWKTSDAGQTWDNISDGFLTAASIGAISVAPSDANVLYVGTGSDCPRGNISPGNGMYRSTDGGKTWSHIGLEDAGQVGGIQVHPDDPDLVYVAVLGHIFGPNETRGVYRSTDGGKSWNRALFVSDRAGAVDIAMNPKNPRIVFAAIWEAERKPWTMDSGGEQSGLFRSTDGGDTWDELTEGLPTGIKGRIAVSVSPANPNRVFALIEAEEGGLFRSEDGGDKFRSINADRNFRQRAWYYTHVFADPQNANTVYIANVGLWRSVDAGKSFTYIRAPHGDHHALWINPENPQALINGNDGGANISFNGGKTWSTQTNQPTAEMYRVSVDNEFPYRVYGCQQDNSCVSVPSRTSSSSIARQHWYVIGGCESGHVAIDPRNQNVTYSGCYGGQISRYDHSTGQDREIMAYPQLAVGQAAKDLKFRFQWNAPIRLSPHDPNVLYHTSQFIHRSQDEGQNWEIISPDLTRNDLEKQGYAGGPLTLDNTGVEVFGTVFAFEESAQTPGLLWAGSDDGMVHLSRDNGATWTDITPSGMPEWGQVNSIELSAHDPSRAFLAVTRYRLDDFRPYIFRTSDHGASWQQLASGDNGIPSDHFVRVVREDPDRQGLLYAGTEFGLYVSSDDGASWQSMQLNLPISPVTDLAVTQQDLVVATQGRSFWILDDLSALHQISPEITSSQAHLFEPRQSYRFGGGFSFDRGGAAGKNPPAGAVLYYWLDEEPEEEVVLEILDSSGEVLRTLSSTKEEPQAPNPWRQFMTEFSTPRKLSAKPGLNRYVWDLRLADAEIEEDAVLWGSARGPKVAPGTFQARLTVGEWTQTRNLDVVKDPRLEITQDEFDAQFELSKQIWSTLTESHHSLRQLRDVRQQINELTGRLTDAGLGDGLDEMATECDSRLSEIEKKIYQTRTESSQDVLNYPPRLDAQILGLLGVVQSADAAPTQGSVERYQDLLSELQSIQAELDQVLEGEVARFSQAVGEKSVPAIIVPGE